MNDQQAAAEIVAKLKELQSSGDTEAAHGDADDALCALLWHLGYREVVEEYRKIEKWYA